ncbi:IS3 family transposase [Xenophilus sp. Marseille-Q4582]|uniref:IS3 family transposase n=1 Tax=Xenophilus sp. Marseille-Q4582 TaxID=2866600 RepID=UPI001CE3C58A|nr:IS3 family transposase [Xenophilus sp. Marseille-Q4582]
MKEGRLPKRQYTQEFKAEAIRLAASVGGHEAARRLGVPVATLGNWSRKGIAAAGSGGAAVPPSEGPTRRPVSELEAENSRLRRELADAKLDVEVLRKGDGVLRQGVAMKYAWIDEHRDQYTVSRLCRVLQVSRSGYCQWRVRPPSAGTLANQALDAKVAAIHDASRRSYGRPRIVHKLRQQGEVVSAERVRKSLRRQGLRPVYRRPFVVTTDSAHCLPVAANLLDRRFDGWQSDQAWVADITYVATGEGWLYLAAVMDLAGRRIVGWSMSETIDATLVCTALKSSWWQRKPPKGLLVHSDRGAQYASGRYRALVAELGITMSMSRKANAWDNAPMESFFKTLKVERIYQVRYDTRAQARLDIVDWIEGWYNRQRLHSANGFLPPVIWESTSLAA